MKKLISVFILVISELPYCLYAVDAEKDPPLKLSSHISWTEILLPLFTVVVLIFTLAWLVKKFGRGLPVMGGGIKIISVTSVTHQAKLLVVRVAEEDMLLGVTNQQVRLLKTYPEPLNLKGNEESSKTSLSKTFANLIKRNKDIGGSTKREAQIIDT